MEGDTESRLVTDSRHKRPSPSPLKNSLLQDHINISFLPNLPPKATAITTAICEATTSKLNNGDIAKDSSSLSASDKEICRLFQQYLQSLGLSRTVEQLVIESGCLFEDPLVSKFKRFSMQGKWEEAIEVLYELEPLMTSSIGVLAMKFYIYEQKYLELLSEKNHLEALLCLRNYLTPLNFRRDRVHELTYLMVCEDLGHLKVMANWGGRDEREVVADKLLEFLPTSLMLPPRRLLTLLHQAVAKQQEMCQYHVNKNENRLNFQNLSLFHDHLCSKDSFPIQTTQILTEHDEQVWYCKFSPDGLMLATGSKDGILLIWRINQKNHKLELLRSFGQVGSISMFSWSGDCELIVSCGADDSADLTIWNVETGEKINQINHSTEDSLTCVSWFSDHQSFVTAGLKGQFYQCDRKGNLLNSWNGVRTQFLATVAKHHSVLFADSQYRLRQYSFDDKKELLILQEDKAIMSFTVNDESDQVLLNLADQGLNLWDLKKKECLMRFSGVVQGFYTIHSCFGGPSQNFIASGSEDNKVYIYHKTKHKPLFALEGHLSTVNCVDWNPKNPSMLASVSDDNTIRIWGPASSSSSSTPFLSTSSSSSLPLFPSSSSSSTSSSSTFSSFSSSSFSSSPSSSSTSFSFSSSLSSSSSSLSLPSYAFPASQSINNINFFCLPSQPSLINMSSLSSSSSSSSSSLTSISLSTFSNSSSSSLSSSSLWLPTSPIRNFFPPLYSSFSLPQPAPPPPSSSSSSSSSSSASVIYSFFNTINPS